MNPIVKSYGPGVTLPASQSRLARKRFLLEGLEGRKLLAGDGFNTIQNGEVHPIPAFDTTVVSITRADGTIDPDNIAYPGDGIQSIVLADYYGFEVTEFTVDDSGNMKMIADGVEYGVQSAHDIKYTADTDGADFSSEILEGHPIEVIQSGFAVRLNPEGVWEMYQIAIRETPVATSNGSGTSTAVDTEEERPVEAEVPVDSSIPMLEAHTEVLQWQDVMVRFGDGELINVCTLGAYEILPTSDVSTSPGAPTQLQVVDEHDLVETVSTAADISKEPAMPIVLASAWRSGSFAGSFFSADERKNADDASLDI